MTKNKITIVKVAAGLVALPLCLVGCVEEQDVSELDDLGQLDEFEEHDELRGYDPPHVPPYLCENPEEQFSRPPTGGACETEIVFTSSQFVEGQGISEGKGEISIQLTATDVDAKTVVEANYPSSGGYAIYSVGEKKHHSIPLGSYSVPVGTTKDVKVCATFTEHDFGGANGDDDIAKMCSTVTLSCDKVDGQPTITKNLGPKKLCGPNTCNGAVAGSYEVMRADADGDGVPNADDFTPEPCDEYNKGKKGIALLQYYHYDDGAFTKFAQSFATNLAKNYGAYDYVALVIDSDSSNPNGLNSKAIAEADVVFTPTRRGLKDAMRHLTANGYRFDIQTHAHGYERPNVPGDARFDVLKGNKITGTWLVEATEPEKIGTARGGIPIVAAWATACFNGLMAPHWHEIGALVASGAQNVNFYPNAFANFWNAWVGGTQYRTSVSSSVTGSVVTASESLIYTQGQLPPYSCLNVLGTNPCAEDFFNDDLGPNDAQYDLSRIYNVSRSGSYNMSRASSHVLSGDRTTVFGAPAAVWP